VDKELVTFVNKASTSLPSQTGLTIFWCAASRYSVIKSNKECKLFGNTATEHTTGSRGSVDDKVYIIVSLDHSQYLFLVVAAISCEQMEVEVEEG
jgi:hypothetical protein